MSLYHYHESTMEELLETMTQDLIRDPNAPVIGPSVQHHNIVGQADSCVFDYNLANSWVTRSRWTSLVNQYINQVALDQFLDLIEAKLNRPKSSGVAFLRSQTVKARNEGTQKGRVARRWGSCMLGWSFRQLPEPQLTMHSRSTYFGFIAPLDMMVASRLAQAIGDRVGLDPSQIKFNWYLEQGAFHGYRSMAYWWTKPEHTELLKEVLQNPEEYPISRHIRGTLQRYQRDDKMKMLYGDMTFAQHRRFRMLWHLRTKTPEFYNQFLGNGLAANQKSMPTIKECWISSLPFKSKIMTYNEDAEGAFDDDTFYPDAEDDSKE